MTPLSLTPVDFSLHLLDCRARLPFRFGITTMTAAPLCLLRIVAETDQGVVEGYASDLLVPKWFVKNPDASIADDWTELIDDVRGAAALAVDGARTDSTFGHWKSLYDQRTGDSPSLLRGHGVSMIERAMIDVVCRAASVDFQTALCSGLLGFDAARVDVGSQGWDVSRSLQATARDTTYVRHTIGLADPLTEGDIDAPVEDGLPVSLDQEINRHGLRYFKIKIAGDSNIEERLARVGAVIRRCAGDDAQVTLDANEQAESMASLADALDRARSNADAAWLIDRVCYIEQPLSRRRSFDLDACDGVERLNRYGGCIIDEADDSIDALARAAALGYRGVSIKNCKGVFRAIANRGRCERSKGLFQSGEDLTNLPVVALQQDLATMGLLGMTHVERNGHHYFDGLSFLPEHDRAAAIDRHPDLYEGDAAAAHLRIENGQVRFGSVMRCAGYGYDGPIDLESWIPADDWSPARLLGDPA